MFMGTYHNSIDTKNRMIVPSKHRDRLGGRCVLTRGLDPCLYIYSMEEWEKQVEKASALPESDPKVRAFVRFTFANAVECEFDKQGRIVIPAELKEFARIDKELITMGAMKKIEIWSKEVWEQTSKMDQKDFADSLEAWNY